MADLLELAARCEAAEGHDRELNFDVWEAVYPANANRAFYNQRACLNRDLDDETKDARARARALLNAPEYTASLDAAMMLVPEGLSFTLYAHPGDVHCEIFRFHPSKGLVADVECVATPALALCAAALRARAPTPRTTPDG